MVKDGITDDKRFIKAVGNELVKKSHIKDLEELEHLIVDNAPLNTNYDLSRPQKAFFDEFGYTEILGEYIYVYPLSTEVACQLLHQLPSDGDPEAILEKSTKGDKYINMKTGDTHKSVVFLPGSNLIWDQTSKENLYRIMHEDQDAVIKPHPLTNKEDIRKLKLSFGVTRMLDTRQSGFEALVGADKVYVTATTELCAYATLMGKEVNVVGQFFKEYRGTYYPIYLLRNDPNKMAKAFSTPEKTGIFHKDTPKEKIQEYFNYVMDVRETHRPITSSYYKEDE